jgi:nitrate reductase gamma subunit
MKAPPLSETQFDLLSPDALDPNGNTEDEEIDWTSWAVGSGVACLAAFCLIFVNRHFADRIFQGNSLELAENLSYFLIAVTIGLGGYCVYASFRAYASKNKTAKTPAIRKGPSRR